MDIILEIVVTAVTVLALVVPLVALVAHHRTQSPYDPWVPAGNGSWRDGEPDPRL